MKMYYNSYKSPQKLNDNTIIVWPHRRYDVILQNEIGGQSCISVCTPCTIFILHDVYHF